MPAPRRGRISRFTVMAMLQAARASALGLPRNSAYSWGLNRAIFYAAAKRGFLASRSGVPGEHAEGAASSEGRTYYKLGDDEAVRDTNADGLVFIIGGEPQTEEAFQRQVASRFGTTENFRAAWSEAEKRIGKFDRATLESRRGFYDQVYKPVRDILMTDWAARFGAPPST
ncbi:MAG TPA: hypothetical protein VGV89_00815 [Thermoplasmata archaeon]|nr:hypothetical protein [Thermoplasmata archaeon]